MTGWKIVCPDGKERHFPYINHGDAACDARVFDRPSHACECGAAPHTVEPIPAYTVPNPGGVSPHGAS